MQKTAVFRVAKIYRIQRPAGWDYWAVNNGKLYVSHGSQGKRGARTIAYNEKSGTLFLPTADYEAPAKEVERPRMTPGTFQVLVVKAAQ